MNISKNQGQILKFIENVRTKIKIKAVEIKRPK